jgi:hypothetical protein
VFCGNHRRLKTRDGAVPEFEIRISDHFLETAVLAGVEAYHLGDGRRRRGAQSGLETIGNVWGVSLPLPEGGRLLHLERFTLTQAAQRTNGSVLPDPRARVLAIDVMKRWSPHLRMLGDLHTHPYSTLAEVREVGGFEFSPQDFAVFDNDDDRWETADGFPVMLALTVCRLQRVREGGLDWPRPNLWQFDVGQFRLWLNVCVGWQEGGERCNTGNSHSSAHLVPPMHYNNSQMRVQIDKEG